MPRDTARRPKGVTRSTVSNHTEPVWEKFSMADDNLSTRAKPRNNGEENHNDNEYENTHSTGGHARHA
jgi:hypothetical protein